MSYVRSNEFFLLFARFAEIGAPEVRFHWWLLLL